MKQLHVIAVISVFAVICVVAHVLATGSATSLSAQLASVSGTVTWLVAGGVAVLCALQEARVSHRR